MKIIGLCGGSGSGKGEVSKCFENRGIPSLDTDALYHSMISTDSDCSNEIYNAFGDSVLQGADIKNGIDRKRLAELVFSDKSGARLKKLNSITHKFILDGCRSWLKAKEKDGCSAAIIDAPLLFESGFNKECDVIICVKADEDARIARILKRDNATQEMAVARVRSQVDNDFLERNSDYIIKNSSTIDELDLQVEKICRLITK